MTEGRSAGVALILGGIALASVSVLEFAAGEARGDGDNPAESLDYLAEYGGLYSYSGLALVLGAAAIIVGIVGVLRMAKPASLAFEAVSVGGLIAAGGLAVSGVMRMQAVGTVPHIQNLDQDWGESAYLVVQIAGTQGLLSTGFIALAAWLVGFAIMAWRRGVRRVVPLVVFPAVVLLVLVADLAFPGLAALAGEGLFLGYIAGIVIGMPVCIVGFGIALLVPTVRTELASATLSPTPVHPTA